jgi:phospholipid/cholesterol/gamma-HCH transport system substrate-binding protein
VVVEVELDDDMRIPKESKGELVTDMLGTVKMNLKLNLGCQEYYATGDTLPGYVNNGLMGIAETAMPKLETMLPKMDSILSSLNQLLANPALAATLSNAEKLTGNLDITTRNLNKLMQNELPVLTSKLTSIADNFVNITGNLKEIDYAGTMQKVDATLQEVKLLTSKLNSKDNTVGLLFNDPTLYNNLNATTANAASLLEDLKAHPKRYVHFSLFGRKEKSQETIK